VRLGVVRAKPEQGIAAHKDYSSLPPVPGIRVTLADAAGPIAARSESDFPSGRVEVPLAQPTRAARRARVCVRNLGDKVISLAGEFKRLRPHGQVFGPRLSITFLSADRSTWASRLDTVETRFRYSHSGAIGTWALWLASLLMAGTVALAFYLIATRTRGA
jgi:hypothetical protein